jgi:uncharacterized phage-associated protein
MKIDFEKVGIIASYFAENTKELYVTKLLKLFYYLDFISYKSRGASVTNDIYFKMPYGPVPSNIKDHIDLLSEDNIFGGEFKSQLSPYIKLEKSADGNGNLIISKGKEYNLRKLSNSELELVKCIAETFKDTKAKALSNQTHREKPWLSTSDFSVIDYGLADGLDVEKILPTFSGK